MFMLRRCHQLSKRCYSSGSLPQPHRNPKLPNTKLFINNEWVEPLSGEKFTSRNPTTEQVITEISRAREEDVDRAAHAAKKAFKKDSPWRKMDLSIRSKLITKLADLIERDTAYMSSLETLDCGKIYSVNVRGDLPRSIMYYRYYAGSVDKIHGITSSIDGNFIAYTTHEPVGVCGIIVPWNYPLFMVAICLAPALAAGCTVVLKPSQHSSLTALHLGELIKEAGFPPGVVNIVTGLSDTGESIVKHSDIDKISFVGSTSVGKGVFRNGADTMKRLTLQLGGKSPNIILPDADVDTAVDEAQYAAFHNMGQCCCAGSRTFVHESMYDEFVDKSITRSKAKKIGDPFDLSVEHGPQTTEDQLNIVMDMIESGKKEGATLLAGGNKLDRPGYFVEPTVFGDVKDEMTIAKEEIFGPVQQILKYKSLDEVIQRANNTDYGLAAAVYGKNVDQINTVVQGMRAGSMWVNCYFRVSPASPFGGFKKSGIGRIGGVYGLNEYLEVKSVFMRTPTQN